MLTLTTHIDAHGNPVSGPQDAVDRYDTAVDHLLAYRNELLDAMTSLADRRAGLRDGTGPRRATCRSPRPTLPDLAGARQIAADLDTLDPQRT